MSSTTTQKTEIPDPTPEEKALMQMMTDGLMPAYLEQTGYDVTKSEGKYEDTAEYKQFNEQRQRAMDERKGYEQELEAIRNNPNNASRYGGDSYSKTQELNQKISRLNGALDKIDSDEQNFLKDYHPETSYDVRKMGSPEVEAARADAIAKYGNLSDEELRNMDGYYNRISNKYENDAIEADKAQRQLVDTYMEKTQKFLDGDFSITDAQKAEIQNNMAPIREAVNKMFDEAKAAVETTATEARAEVAQTNKNLLKATAETFNNFDKQIKDTGMNMIQGLDVVGSQIRQTGADMETALKNTIGVHRELMKMGIEDYTGQVTKQVAANAAMLGRSPDDPEYTNEMQQLVARKVEDGSLNLAAMEAQGMLSIKERTGAGLEGVDRSKVGVAERTGGMLEQSALQRGNQNLSIAEREGMAREGITANLNASREEMARARGSADVGLEETASNLRWQVGAGMAPQQVGLAQGVQQYNSAIAQQRIQNASSAMMAPMPYVGYMQQERMAEPTTTQTTNPGIGGIFSGIIGAASAGASIYGGVASAGAMSSLAGGMGGGGGGSIYGGNYGRNVGGYF